MSDWAVILTPIITALIAGVGALWRRSVKQREDFVTLKEENAGLKADLRAANQDIAQLKDQLQARVLSEDYLLAYIDALEAGYRKHKLELPKRPRLSRIVQRAIQTLEEQVDEAELDQAVKDEVERHP